MFCQVEVSASADHLSREVLPSVVCLSVIVKLVTEETLVHWGLLYHVRCGGETDISETPIPVPLLIPT